MDSTKVTVFYNKSCNTVEDLKDGDYFVSTDEYNEQTLYLYVNKDCIIDIEKGIEIEPTYFELDDEIEIVKKMNITVEE